MIHDSCMGPHLPARKRVTVYRGLVLLLFLPFLLEESCQSAWSACRRTIWGKASKTGHSGDPRGDGSTSMLP